MADITKGTIGLDTVSAVRGGLQITELFAGEALVSGDGVYIKSDGKVWKAVSTAVEATNVAAFAGVVVRDYPVGAPVTIFGQGCVIQLGTVTPGQLLYVSDTAGLFATTKVATADTAKAKAISTTAIVIL